MGPNGELEITWPAWNNYVYDTGTWNAWNNNILTTGSTNVIVWDNWVATATNTANTGWVVADNNVWPNWVGATGSTIPVQVIGPDGVPLNPWQPWVAQAELTQEERDRQQAEREHFNRLRIEQERELEVRYAAQAKEMEEDRVRAKRLLNSTLNVHQRKQMKDKGHFDVVTKSGRRYRIRKGTHGNVHLLDNEGREINSYCIAPVNASRVPDEDTMVAQKLALEADEDRFLHVANARRLVA